MASGLAEKDRSDKAQTRMMLETIGKFIGAQLKPLQRQIEELKTQVEELKRSVAFRIKEFIKKVANMRSATWSAMTTVSGAAFSLRKRANRPVHSQANGKWP